MTLSSSSSNQPSDRSVDAAIVPWTQFQRWTIIASIVAIAISFNLRAIGAQNEDDNAGQPPNYQTQGVMPMSAGATADSNSSMIAVTGVDVTGQSVLYLVDTERMQLNVYQASGGAASTRGLRMIAARNIEFDMQLNGFNDKTEDKRGRALKYGDLEKQFRDSGLLDDEQ
ncbi:MAG: hypothetical protein ACI841_001863 [Planctomycetota bacterium]|jgi:hypothetical protein